MWKYPGYFKGVCILIRSLARWFFNWLLRFFSFWPWSLPKPPEAKVWASATSNFSWRCQLSYEVLFVEFEWKLKHPETAISHRALLDHPRILNWPKSPHRLGLIHHFPKNAMRWIAISSKHFAPMQTFSMSARGFYRLGCDMKLFQHTDVFTRRNFWMPIQKAIQNLINSAFKIFFSASPFLGKVQLLLYWKILLLNLRSLNTQRHLGSKSLKNILNRIENNEALC